MNLDTLFPHYCEILLKSTAVLVAVALLLKHWRGASAATRHLVWAGTMVVLIALMVIVTVFDYRRYFG